MLFHQIDMFYTKTTSGVDVVLLLPSSVFCLSSSVDESGHWPLIKHSRRTTNDSTVEALARLRFSATIVPPAEK